MLNSNAVSKMPAARLLGIVILLGMALFGMSSPTHAEAVVTQTTHEYPQSFMLDSACAPDGQEEDIAVNLTSVVQFTRIADVAGNFHWTISQMWRNVSAVGLTSGGNYEVLFRARAVSNSGTAAREFTSLYDMMLVGPNGDSSVYTYRIIAHYTISAEGTLENYIWENTNECS